MKLAFYFVLLSIIISCGNHNSEHKINTDSKLKVEKTEEVRVVDNHVNTEKGRPIALKFTERLKKGENLASLFGKTWTFIYHEENRCTGSTDGKVTYGSKITIDHKLQLQVKNNSEYAWACEKKEPYHFEMIFNLKENLKHWDRIELQSSAYSDESDKQENTFFILGAGESDYIKIYINENNLISTFKYSSEDPG